ncbi:MAG: response regulator [Myxococcota bacterium]|nr:response regulator [Myxococcota bacterium]
MDGFEAIELSRAHQSQIDVVLLGIAMPGLSGEETLHAQREICPELPLVLVSGHATKEFDQLRELGEVATLRKPFTLEALATAVADLVHTER